jgi:hypothetical protein
VTATITNVGAVQDNRTVELRINTEQVDTARLDLRAGASETIVFDVPDEAYGPGNHVVEVLTPHDRQEQLLVIREPTTTYEIASFGVGSPVTAGDPLAVNATLLNTGTVRGEGEVTLRVGETVLGTETVEAFDGETVKPAFANVSAQLDPGTYRLTLATNTDEETIDLTVEPARGELLVSDIAVDAPVVAGESLNATATITNTAGSEQGGEIRVSLDGETRLTENVTLAGGTDDTLTLGETIGSLSAGEYSLTVETPDDEQTVEIVVEESGDSDRSGENGGDDTGGTGPGLVGLGIGTRELAVGTAAVGAVHVLGYWL